MVSTSTTITSSFLYGESGVLVRNFLKFPLDNSPKSVILSAHTVVALILDYSMLFAAATGEVIVDWLLGRRVFSGSYQLAEQPV